MLSTGFSEELTHMQNQVILLERQSQTKKTFKSQFNVNLSLILFFQSERFQSCQQEKIEANGNF
jgi:hypothetical protein